MTGIVSSFPFPSLSISIHLHPSISVSLYLSIYQPAPPFSFTMSTTTYRKLQVHTLSSDFRRATHIITQTLPSPSSLKPYAVLIQVYYAGINASDINYCAGRYTPGVKPPMDCGFEGIGVIRAVGSKLVKNRAFRVGSTVGFTSYGAFSEYTSVSSRQCVPLPMMKQPDPRILPLLVSGVTASIALDEVGELHKTANQTVLVTAAAGGTGVFAVQLAKLAGHHVIGTCSSPQKAAMLKKLGCDRVVNYKQESLFRVLKKEYPKGLDIVYECVGGEMFEAATKKLAAKGRLIVIGAISGYKNQTAFGATRGPGTNSDGDSKVQQRVATPLPMRLLRNSSSVRGFFLNDYSAQIPAHIGKLSALMQSGKLVSVVDPNSAEFFGLEDIARALDHMYSGGNAGKVVVRMCADAAPLGATKSRL
jgi:prostaglandin reductase 3